MPTLDQRQIDKMFAIANQRVDAKIDGLRHLMFRNGSVPPGMKVLETPEEKRLYAQHIQRSANREAMGTIPGDINTTLAAHPAIQAMAAEVQPETEAL